MVHSGAVVAAGVSQGKTRLCGFDTSFSKFSDFRNDREKRDFVACGAAAGVCSAFGSPIGGVLFSLEEASSYFSTKLTWYVKLSWPQFAYNQIQESLLLCHDNIGDSVLGQEC